MMLLSHLMKTAVRAFFRIAIAHTFVLFGAIAAGVSFLVAYPTTDNPCLAAFGAHRRHCGDHRRPPGLRDGVDGARARGHWRRPDRRARYRGRC
jgi:hypothetical protein